MAQHPGIARRTAQRLIAKLIESELVIARGEGRARHYFAAGTEATVDELIGGDEIFPDFIPESADSRDVLTCIEQPQKARKPVGYQKDFLDSYHPNETGYLSDSLRRQLHKIVKTTEIDGFLTGSQCGRAIRRCHPKSIFQAENCLRSHAVPPETGPSPTDQPQEN